MPSTGALSALACSLALVLATDQHHLEINTHALTSFSPASSIASQSFIDPTPAPFLYNEAVHEKDGPGRRDLAGRQQGSCASSYTACTNLNKPGICCQPDTICTTDNAANIACCLRGAVCTGTIGGGNAGTMGSMGYSPVVGTGNSAATSVQGGAGGAGQGTTTVTVFAGYSSPVGNTVSEGDGVLTGTVPNAPFPFSYIPRTFANAAQCSSYYTSCQNTFASCTAALGGGSGPAAGVTIIGAGITTMNGAATGGSNPTSAASACSSISSLACYGLQASQCPAYGTANSNNAGGWNGIAADAVRAGAGLAFGFLGLGLV